MLRILTEGNAVVEHSRPDGEFQRRWALNDVDEVQSLSSESTPSNLGTGAAWMCVETGGVNCWMVPRENLRLSAGVPLKTIRPRAVISSHVGEVLLFQGHRRLGFVLLGSFVDGLNAVRQRFEQEFEGGRQAATTAEERVCYLRKCRDRMNAYSDDVVAEHIKELAVEWKDDVAGRSFRGQTVLHLTTPDGRLVDSEDETNVAVVGDDWHIIVRVSKEGNIDAEWKEDVDRMMISPAGGCHRKAFGQKEWNRVVFMIRYVRDSDTETDAIQLSKFISFEGTGKGQMLSVRGGDGATCRWLVFLSSRSNDVNVCDTETGKMAYLRTPSRPSGAMETSDGLWMWGMGDNFDRWSRLFKVDALQSVMCKVLSTVNRLTEPVQRRVVDTQLEAEAFCKGAFNGIRGKTGRHPGHYWVVAGYGPVPPSLRAPEHIYKELQSFEELRRYEGFPYWFARDNTQSWLLEETSYAQWSPIWTGAVDVRDGVTAESIKEDAKSNAWRVGETVENKPSGEFLVRGDRLLACLSSGSLEVPVQAGRWLWKLQRLDGGVELTLWHESVSDVDVMKCTKPTWLVHSRMLEWHLAQLRCLVPVIPEGGLRAKIAEFNHSVYRIISHPISALLLLDKNVIGKESGWHMLRDSSKARVTPLTGGLALDFEGSNAFFVEENVIRIRAREANLWRPMNNGIFAQ